MHVMASTINLIETFSFYVGQMGGFDTANGCVCVHSLNVLIFWSHSCSHSSFSFLPIFSSHLFTTFSFHPAYSFRWNIVVCFCILNIHLAIFYHILTPFILKVVLTQALPLLHPLFPSDFREMLLDYKR